MKTIPIIPSCYFNWMGFSGFTELTEIRPQFDDGRMPTEFCVESDKTGTVVAFKFMHSVYSDVAKQEVESYIFEGYTKNGTMLTLIVHND
jgi:hypothetical protein